MNTVPVINGVRISAVTRTFIAALQYAKIDMNIAMNFGKAVLNILRKNFPDDPKHPEKNVDMSPEFCAEVGKKMYYIARKEVQYNEQDAYDLVQEFLTYIATGTDRPVNVYDKKTGELIKEAVPNQPFDFKSSKNWKTALGNIYYNLKTRGISRSRTNYEMQKVQKTDPKGNPMVDEQGNPVMVERQRRKQKSIDDAFGKRTTEGGPREMGEQRMMTPPENALSESLDNRAAIDEFLDAIHGNIPAMKKDRRFTFLESELFDLVMDGTGSFSNDIQENMGAASALRKRIEDIAADDRDPKQQEAIKLLEDIPMKKWSATISRTRTLLLEKIESYVEHSMSKDDYLVLHKYRNMPMRADRLDSYRGLSDVVPDKSLDPKGYAEWERANKKHPTASLLAMAYRVAFLNN